jgi:hypothetical protein
MFKKKEDEKKAETAPPRDEHAYEDSWYRSLKALREQEPDGDGSVASTAGGASGDDDEPALEQLDDPEPEAEAVDTQVPEPTVANVEARAGELLERLRTLQHLGDQQDDGSDPAARSAFGD